MKSAQKISIVIPVFNNAVALEELNDRLHQSLQQLTSNYEIIYINDGSIDNSLLILSEIAAGVKEVKVLNLSRNFGQHPAICAGFEHATGDIVVLMDADLQDRPEDIGTLVKKLREDNSDIVYTIKQTSDKKLATRLTSAVYHAIFSRIVKTDVPLNIGTFRAFNRQFLDAVLQFKEANVLYGPLMFFMGFKTCFVELEFTERPHGKSAYTFSKRLHLAITSLVSYTDIPHKITVAFGALMLAGSIVYALIVALQFVILGSSLPSGSTLILLLICLTFGSVMFTLGVIGSYVFRVYQEVLRRPRYLVQERINIKPTHPTDLHTGSSHG